MQTHFTHHLLSLCLSAGSALFFRTVIVVPPVLEQTAVAGINVTLDCFTSG